MTLYNAAQKELNRSQYTGLVFRITKEVRDSDNLFTQLQMKWGARQQLLATDNSGLIYVYFGSSILDRALMLQLLALEGLKIDGIKAYVELPVGSVGNVSKEHPDGAKATYALFDNSARVSDYSFRTLIEKYTIDKIIFLNEYSDFLEANGYNVEPL